MDTPKDALGTIPDGIWILFSILLLLLSIPLGVITNGASYFLLGWIQELLVQLCIDTSVLSLVIMGSAGFTKRKFDYKMIVDKFGIKKELNNFYQISQYFETLLSVKYPDVSRQFGYIIGCSRLSRNFALLDIGIFGYIIIASSPVGLPLKSLIFLITPLITILVIKILYLNEKKLTKIQFSEENKKILALILLTALYLCFIMIYSLLLTNEGTFLLILFKCYLIFAFFICISSLLEFYYYINILHATRVLSKIDETLEKHISNLSKI